MRRALGAVYPPSATGAVASPNTIPEHSDDIPTSSASTPGRLKLPPIPPTFADFVGIGVTVPQEMRYAAPRMAARRILPMNPAATTASTDSSGMYVAPL
jgi:hypothetical protein